MKLIFDLNFKENKIIFWNLEKQDIICRVLIYLDGLKCLDLIDELKASKTIHHWFKPVKTMMNHKNIIIEIIKYKSIICENDPYGEEVWEDKENKWRMEIKL